MKLDVAIRDVAIGETRVYRPEQDYETPFDDYIWSEGNYACDCNRALFFAAAAGEERDDSINCSDGRFVIAAIKDRATGALLYTELEED